MKKTLYITQETQDRLAKLGGPTPSANLRRAVALAEVAGELAEALESCALAMQSGSKHGPALDDADHALNQYKEAKQ